MGLAIAVSPRIGNGTIDFHFKFLKDIASVFSKSTEGLNSDLPW